MLGWCAFGTVSFVWVGFVGIGFGGNKKCARRSENIWSEAYILLPDFLTCGSCFDYPACVLGFNISDLVGN